MAFSPAFIDELVAQNPIEDVVGQYVSLKRSGANMFGLCPFHGEKTASFSVAPDKGIYYCFGCHKGGGVVNFMMEVEGLSYPDAVRALAKRAGLEVPEDEQYQSRYRQQERLWAVNAEAARYFYSKLYEPVGARALRYAQDRGLSKSTLINFGIGYCPDDWDGMVRALRTKGYTDEELEGAGLVTKSQRNGKLFDRFRGRLMFPIIDVRGKVIGFGGRTMSEDKSIAKYLNSPETSVFNKRKNLFAMNLAKKSKLGYIILVEGYMDAIALHQYGFDCAVASLGTALNEEGANLLCKYTDQVILIYDGDNAGQSATQRAIPILEKTGLVVRVLKMRDAKDPDEYLKKYGADKFKLLLEGSTNRVEYQLDAIAKKYDLSSAEERGKFNQECAEFVSTIDSAIQREIYCSWISEKGKVSIEAVVHEMEKALKKRVSRDKKKKEAIDMAPARMLQPTSRNLRYDNVHSAIAEEIVISMIIKEPALLDQTVSLKPEFFSSPIFGKAYDQFVERFRQGMTIHPGVLVDMSAEEISHIIQICNRHNEPVNEDALADCVHIILAEHQASTVTNDEELLRYQSKLKERKGIK